MNQTEPKPAARLSATMIRRGEGHASPSPMAPGDEHGTAAGTSGELAIPPAPGKAGARPRRRRAMSWHGAGLFGMLYLAALALFATAFDMWPK